MDEQAEFWFDPGTRGHICLRIDLLEKTALFRGKKVPRRRKEARVSTPLHHNLKKKWQLHTPTNKKELNEASKWKTIKFKHARLSSGRFTEVSLSQWQGASPAHGSSQQKEATFPLDREPTSAQQVSLTLNSTSHWTRDSKLQVLDSCCRLAFPKTLPLKLCLPGVWAADVNFTRSRAHSCLSYTKRTWGDHSPRM